MLAPLRAKSEAPESFGMARPEECAVLYLSYCLSEDQSWLLAAATDDRGEIFETATINIDIPNRKRRKRASARRIGLQKLMDFILSVMSQGVSKKFTIQFKLMLSVDVYLSISTLIIQNIRIIYTKVFSMLYVRNIVIPPLIDTFYTC